MLIKSIWLYWTTLLLLTHLPTAASISHRYQNQGALVVNTTSGLVRGTYINPDLKAFRGIPYPQPPVGELRFEPPKAIEKPSDTIIDATRYGYVCLQHRYKLPIPLPLNEDQENEDCLTLNVFVPQSKWNSTSGKNQTTYGKKVEEPLPVLIWIYGGGFAEGYAAGKSSSSYLHSAIK